MAELLRHVEELCHKGKLEKAFQSMELIEGTGIPVPRSIAYFLLDLCSEKKDKAGARRLQNVVLRNGLDSYSTLNDNLIRLFASCGCLLEANQGFNGMAKPSIYTWNAVISANSNLGQCDSALDLYTRMQFSDVRSNNYVCITVLKACALIGALEHGRLIHNQIIDDELEPDISICNTLVDMYAKCGNLEDAHSVFDKISNRDVVSWGIMISAYARFGRGLHALELFAEMQENGLKPQNFTYSSTLKACGSIGVIEHGREIHYHIIRSGIKWDVVLGNTLVDMYAKCGSLLEARQVFDKLEESNEASWGAVIAGYARDGHGIPALELFCKMINQGIVPHKVTFLNILKACSSIGAIEQGRLIHENIIKLEFGLDVVVGSSMIDMYAKCGSLREACKTFEGLKVKDDVSWGAMISGYADHGHGLCALEHFEKMQEGGASPHKATFLSGLKACNMLGTIQQGRVIHSQLVIHGLESDIIIGSSLVDMYAKCGSLREAREVFDKLENSDVVLWGAMISGYAQHGHGYPAMELYERMQQEGMKPQKTTFLGALRACIDVGALEHGRLIHDQVIDHGLESDIVVVSTIVDMYAKCGSLEEASKIFEVMGNRDVIAWGAMIEGYAEYGHGLAALTLFGQMQHEGINPDRVAFLSTLKACAGIAALEQGRLMHEKILESGLQSDVAIGNTLIDVYAKCGSIGESLAVFDNLQRKDFVSWDVLIAGCARSGDLGLLGHCLAVIEHSGMEPNNMTFISILAACSRAGLVDEGRRYFRSMRGDHAIAPNIYHCTCMIDLLSRAGCLGEAKDILETIEPNIIGWTSLLNACRTYGDVELGRKCYENLVLINPGCSPGYILMSNIYADAQMWEDAERIFNIAALIQNQDNKMAQQFMVDYQQGDEIFDILERCCGSLED